MNFLPHFPAIFNTFPYLKLIHVTARPRCAAAARLVFSSSFTGVHFIPTTVKYAFRWAADPFSRPFYAFCVYVCNRWLIDWTRIIRARISKGAIFLRITLNSHRGKYIYAVTRGIRSTFLPTDVPVYREFYLKFENANTVLLGASRKKNTF